MEALLYKIDPNAENAHPKWAELRTDNREILQAMFQI